MVNGVALFWKVGLATRVAGVSFSRPSMRRARGLRLHFLGLLPSPMSLLSTAITTALRSLTAALVEPRECGPFATLLATVGLWILRKSLMIRRGG